MNAETIVLPEPNGAWHRALRWTLIFGLLVAFAPACGPKKITQAGAVPHKASTRWKYVSELDPVKDLQISGDMIWALTGNHLLKAGLSGSGSPETIRLGLPQGETPEMKYLLVDSQGEVWVAGGNDLYKVSGNTIKHIDEVKLNFKEITFLEGGSKPRVAVGGENILATFDGMGWRLRELPFYITGGATAGEAIIMLAAQRGVAKIEGDQVTEYPHPLSETKPFSSGEFVALSAVQVKGELWVLWTGEGSYLSVLDLAGQWNTYTHAPGQAGNSLKLLKAGDRVFLETQLGLYRIDRGSGKGIPLVPVRDEAKAKKLVYKVPGHDILQEGGKYADLKPFTFKPVPRAPIIPPGEVEIEKSRNYTLVPFNFSSHSPLRTLDGSKDFIVVGTEAMGVLVLRDSGAVESEFYTYSARPALPFTIFTAGNNNVYFPLETGEAGMLSGSTIKKVKVGEKPDEKIMGVDKVEDAAYGITLIPSAETVDIYKFRAGKFEKLMERTVDLASGIGSIGGFALAPNGTFWFTIKSYGEGQEMGAAEIRPELGELVYNGAVPMPPEYALILPNGVSSVKIKRDGTVYLGGMDGLVLVRPDRSIKKFQEPEGLVGDFVTDFAVDAGGRVWMVTVEGLGYLEGESLSFPSGIPYRGSGVACVGTSSDGTAIIVDEDGLKTFYGGTWKLLAPRSDIVGSPVLDVQADGIGNIWVVTKRSISIFREK